MRQETRTIYTLEELKVHHPKAYAKVHDRWIEACNRHEAPWSDETIASLKAVVKACGAKLADYRIGPYDYSWVEVEVENNWPDDPEYDGPDSVVKGTQWLLENVLKPNGYVDADGKASFPGLCKWTGYCTDDDMIESVYTDMTNGYTLEQALEDLADIAREHLEDACEQDQEEESMIASWENNEYTETGEEV